MEYETAIVRPNVSKEKMIEEIIQYIGDHPRSDAIDIADGLHLDFKKVKSILDELEQNGTIMGKMKAIG